MSAHDPGALRVTKGEPIPGGPTDPNAPKATGEKDHADDQTEGGRDESEKDEA